MGAEGNSNNQSSTMKVVGGYEILRRIGQGGMGSVFVARQISMNRPVALKILAPHLAKDKTYVERFLREARAAARLSHPNIVQAYDVGNAQGYFYFAMEYVDGVTLKKMMQQSGDPIPEKRALEIVRDIADALRHAHAANIIHRDVKPENILLTSDGVPKLADLGIARDKLSNDSHLTQGAAIGTPLYISPEQARGESDIDGRADVYSLGATLYHILTGQTPYSGGTSVEVISKHLTAPVPDPKKINPKISRAAANIAMKAMAKNKINRYPSATAMAEDILSALSFTPAQPKAAEPVQPRRRKQEQKSVLAPVMAAIFLLVCIGGSYAYFKSRKPTNPPEPPTNNASIDIPKPQPQPKPEPKPQPPKPLPGSDDRLREIDEIAKRMIDNMNQLAAAGDYDAAIKVTDEIPAGFEKEVGPRLQYVADRLKSRAENLIKSGADEIDQLIGLGKLDAAERMLKNLRLIKYSPLSGTLDQAEGRLLAAMDRAAPPEPADEPPPVPETPEMTAALERNNQLYQEYIGVLNRVKGDALKKMGDMYMTGYNQRMEKLKTLQNDLVAVASRNPKRPAGEALKNEAIAKIKEEIANVTRRNSELEAKAHEIKKQVEVKAQDVQYQLRVNFENINDQIKQGNIPSDQNMKDSYLKTLQRVER